MKKKVIPFIVMMTIGIVFFSCEPPIDENRDVRISTTNQNPESFGESVLHEEFSSGANPWRHFPVDLNIYADKWVYISFQCTSVDRFVPGRDAITVTNLSY